MTAPSIKEALELKPCPFCGGEAWMLNGGPGNWFVQCTKCKCTTNDVQRDHAAELWNTRATLSPPARERREAIAQAPFAWAYRSIFNEHSWCLVKDEPNFDNDQYIKEPLILASGLVQDEAAIRADEREKCAQELDIRAGEISLKQREQNPLGTSYLREAKNYREASATIRSARDGGAES